MNTASGLESRSAVPRALVRTGLRAPKSVILVWVALAALATVGVRELRIETSTDSILDRRGPEWTFYQESQRTFGGDEILTLLIEGDSEFDAAVLDQVYRDSSVLSEIEGVWRVDSLATVPLVRSTPDGALSLEPPLADDREVDTERLAQLIRADRIAPRTLVSADERAFAINVVLEQGAERYYDEVLSAMTAAQEGKTAWISGVPVFRTETDARTRSELMLFVPATVIVVGFLLYVLFGSVRAFVIPLVSSAFGTWIMLGAMGAVGVPMTISTVVLPSVLLALGCAYSVHLLSAASRADIGELRAALDVVSLPIALSGLTTALGFIAISFVPIDAIQSIGGFGAFGVLLVLAATLTAGPAALSLWPLPMRPMRMRGWLDSRATPAIVRLATHRRAVLVGAWFAAMALVSLGISQLKIETDVIRWFREDDPIRVSYNVIRERLSGISPMNIVIEPIDGGRVSEHEVIVAIDGLTAHLESLPEVGRALSIADPLRQINGGFSGDPSQPLPTDSAQIAQYMVLLESKRYIHDLITPDRSAANILLRVDDNGSGALVALAGKAQRWWAENGVAGYRAQATGIMFEFGRAQDAIAYGQLRGLAFAFAAVSLILFAIFRWAQLALVALLPNAIPIVMGFGAMGLLGVPLDAGTVVIGNLAFGIAVDDSIHAVTAFSARRGAGSDAASSLKGAYESVLPPLVFTTVAVTLGFAVLGLSDFTLIRHLGLLTAGLMVLCLLADSLLLPALLSWLGEPPKGASPAGDTV